MAPVKRRVILVAIVAALGSSGDAEGRTWKVRASGASDFETIQSAVERAAAGDTVLVGAGTYAENVAVVGKCIALVSEAGAEHTTIEPENPFENAVLINGCETGQVVVEGFTIRNRSNAVQSSRSVSLIRRNRLSGSAEGSGLACSSGHVRVEANEFEANGGPAIAGSAAATMEVVRNRFVGNGRASAERGGAVWLRSCDAVIEGNVFARNVAVDGGAVFAQNSEVVVRENTFVDNTALETGRGSAIAIDGQGRTFVERNIFARGRGSGVLANLRNTRDVKIACNDFWENEGDAVVGGDGDSDAGTNFAADPLFCGAERDDFTVDSASPCVTGGSPAACALVGALGPGCDGGRSSGSERLDATPRSLIPETCELAIVPRSPFSSLVRVRFVVPPPGGPVEIDVCDAGGRVVRRLLRAERDVGTHSVQWNGETERNAPAPGGAYFVRLRAQGLALRRMVVLIRS